MGGLNGSNTKKKKGIGKFLKNSLMKLRKSKKEQRPNLHQEANLNLPTDESKDMLSKTVIPQASIPELAEEAQVQYQSVEN